MTAPGGAGSPPASLENAGAFPSDACGARHPPGTAPTARASWNQPSERGRASCAAGRIGAPLIRPGTPSSPMTSTRLLLVVLALALSGVLVSACGSEDSKG